MKKTHVPGYGRRVKYSLVQRAPESYLSVGCHVPALSGVRLSDFHEAA